MQGALTLANPPDWLQAILHRLDTLEARVLELEAENAELRAENAELRAENAELRAENAELKAENAELKAENAALRERVVELDAENAKLRARIYGPSSERHVPKESTRTKKKPRTKNDAGAQRKRRKNRELREASSVKVEEVVLALEDAEHCGACGGERLAALPSSDSIEWEFIPGHWIKRIYKRQTCICQECKSIQRAEAPLRPCEGSPYGPGLMAHVVVSKVGDSVPLYRQVKQFARLGIPMARSTLVHLFARTASLLEPLHQLFCAEQKEAELVLADETPVKMQGQKAKAYMWVFACAVSVAYIFSVDRSGQTPSKLLKGSQGILVCDGYTGYNAVVTVDGRQRGGCNCHARRKFDVKDSSVREVVFDFYQRLYEVEREAKVRDIIGTEAHQELRDKKSRPIMDEFKTWLDEHVDSYGKKEPIGQAIRYARRQWKELTLFLSDPKVPPDNNRSERLLRLIAIGRKNWLFTGHAEGGKHVAIVASVLATCEMHGVNPQTYIADILLRVQTHPASRIHELHPKEWLTHFGHLYDQPTVTRQA